MRLRRAFRLTFLLAFAAVAPLAIALGQTAPGAPIVSDLPVAGGTERVLFLGTQGARALLVMLPGNDGIIGLDSGGGVRLMGVWHFPHPSRKLHICQSDEQYYCLGSSTSICSRQHFLDGSKGGSFVRRRVARVRFDRCSATPA
jgi:hypothetical protein